MRRFPPLTKEQILERLKVDLSTGRCFWTNPTKFHKSLMGKEAGRLAKCHNHSRWIININGLPYKRAYLVFVVAYGYWPELIDHVDGVPFNDKPQNLREATIAQNNWNHRGRKKKSPTPIGVRLTRYGKFQARIAYNKRTLHLGSFDTVEAAQAVYLAKREELFGAYSGRN